MKTIFVVLCLFIALSNQWAIGQWRSGEDLVIAEKVDHDLYVTGGTVTINAPIHGDLIVAGGTVKVNDTVTEDILVAGGDVSLNSQVSDDIRCAGGTIDLNGSVLGDFIVTGGRMTIGKSAVVSGNLLSSGGEVTLDGRVKGNVQDASGTFTLNGVVEKDLDLKGGKIVINGNVQGKATLAARVIEVGPIATFGSDVNFWNEAGSIDFKKSLQAGKATYDPGLRMEAGKWHYLGFASFLVVLWYLGAALLLIFLLQYLFSTTFRTAADAIKNASVKSLGLGMLFLIGVPIAIVVAFVTLVGIPVGILVLISYVTILLLATIIVALLISNWINNTYYQSSWDNARIAASAFAIFIFLKLASLTPFVGPLVMLLLVAMGLGGILLNVNWRRKKALALT